MCSNTTFANGVQVIVNFADEDIRTFAGELVKARTRARALSRVILFGSG